MGSDSSDLSKSLNDSAAVELTGKIMVAAIIVLFLVVVFVLCLHLYAKCYWWRVRDPAAHGGRHQGQDLSALALRRGLDPSILNSIPVLVFHPQDYKDGLECAVCLSELVEGEKARILPKCNHGFHVGCIDMWFQSHSTCPLCRNPVDPHGVPTDTCIQLPPSNENSNNSPAAATTTESPRFPTNVLFWGNQTRVVSGTTHSEEGLSSSSSYTSRPEGMLVIDIPRSSMPADSCASPLPSESKSPVPTRLRSFKRLLSRDRRVQTPCSPTSVVDVEQGTGRE